MKCAKVLFIVLGCVLFMGCPKCPCEQCKLPSQNLIENETNKYSPNQYEGAIFWGSKQTLIDSGIVADSIITCSCNDSLHMIITSDYKTTRDLFKGVVDPETCNDPIICGGDLEGIEDNPSDSRIDPKDPGFYTNRVLITRNIVGAIPTIDNTDSSLNELRIFGYSPIQENNRPFTIAVLDSGLPTDDQSLAASVPWLIGDLDLVDNTSTSPYFNVTALAGKAFSQRSKGNILHGMLVQQTLELSLKDYGKANEVDILPVRISDFSGKFTLYNLLCGMYTAQKNGANIINASLSLLTNENYEINILKEHVNRITQSGISIVSAQGNDSSNIDCFGVYPAEYSNVYGVSSFRCVENVIDLATSSNYSVKLNTYAEFGQDIFNQDPDIIAASSSIFGGSAFKPISGTSFAAPKFAARLASLKLNGKNLPTHPNQLSKYTTGLTREGKSLNVVYYYNVETKCE